MGSVYDIPYQHKTTNHLFFDRIRALHFEVTLLRDYLKGDQLMHPTNRNLDAEIAALDKVSEILFDDVYKSIREKWL